MSNLHGGEDEITPQIRDPLLLGTFAPVIGAATIEIVCLPGSRRLPLGNRLVGPDRRIGSSCMSQNDEYSPDEPLDTETFEQGDEAADEEARLNPNFTEEAERDPALVLSLQADDRELDEAGAKFDDPEIIALLDGGIDDPDGVGPVARGSNSDDEGWDLDAT
jgi:hypothetical protein